MERKKNHSFHLLDVEPLVPGSEVEEKIGNPQTLNDVGEVTEEAAVKPANNKYSSMRNGYEITFNQNTALPNLENDSIVDVIGLVLYSSEFVFIDKKNKVSRFLEAKLVGSTNTEVTLSLLGKLVDQRIVAYKGVKISNNFGGCYLETLSSTVVQVNPAMNEAHQLREWYNNETQRKFDEILQ
ncbi:hypothetical protein DAPPUDRAFT_330783 [Daphnia pulex]|uniref:Replication protein A OB domain-containing protein n=1 Tax=Daphnia pulex TaxID=6669 RepID=E9HKM9_DAPPU|nr:hypothetical protein DAPPUDRAFT_330783 [Daphnia pulex]|eukprot:EFX67685.1 hypothetical protein DAPPUDRAFT_330783 [Daphnia pulex]